MENNEKPSRRDAIRRMAKVSMGVGMTLQLFGGFAAGVQAAVPSAQGARFGIIGYVSSPAIGVQSTASHMESVTREGCYTNGAGYSNNGYMPYSKYVNCNP